MLTECPHFGTDGVGPVVEQALEVVLCVGAELLHFRVDLRFDTVGGLFLFRDEIGESLVELIDLGFQFVNLGLLCCHR